MPTGERHNARGFTYIGVLALVALIGIFLSVAGEVVSTAARREREAQLLWAGHQYRAAIAKYWGYRRAYPQTLEELLGSGQGSPIQIRCLRKLYPDPMTDKADWVLLDAPNGGIMGVASRSGRAPLKTGRFDAADEDFEKAATYGEWKFTFVPGRIRAR